MESHACTGKIHAGESACTSPPVRLDHLFFTGRFCLQCFVPFPSAVFSYVQTPNLVNVYAQLISLRNEHLFFFRPTPCGFRQVVQQLSKPVAYEINYLIRIGADAVVAAKVNWKRTDT